jgi:mannose-1-phosphate guanylyltransferase/phosphomannomutase
MKMCETINAIILAAGKGTRMGDLTSDIPKPMLRVNGRPILEHIICWLKTNKISDIGINLFTMPEQLLEYFGDGGKLGVRIHYVYEQSLSGTAGALPKFKDWLKKGKPFLVVYGDILTDQPILPILGKHMESNAFATILLHKRKSSNSFVDLAPDSRVKKFIERPTFEELERLKGTNPDGFLVNSAVQILSYDSLGFIENNQCFDLPKDLYAPNCSSKRIYGVELSGKRVAIDSKERLTLAGELFP